jgi:hypothetical protein
VAGRWTVKDRCQRAEDKKTDEGCKMTERTAIDRKAEIRKANGSRQNAAGREQTSPV